MTKACLPSAVARHTESTTPLGHPSPTVTSSSPVLTSQRRTRPPPTEIQVGAVRRESERRGRRRSVAVPEGERPDAGDCPHRQYLVAAGRMGNEEGQRDRKSETTGHRTD